MDSGALYTNVSACSSGSSTPAPTGAASGKVYIIGDSITEGTQPELTSALKKSGFATVAINGKASRSLSEGGSDLNGITVLSNDKSQWSDAQAIVIELGTNGGISNSNIKKTIDTIKASNKTADIYWVSIGVDNSKRSGPPINATSINNTLSSNSSGNYTVIDWASQVKQHPDYIDPNPATGLGVHPTGDGKTAFASTVAAGVNAPSGSTASSPSASSCCTTSSSNSGGTVAGKGAKAAFDFFLSQGFTATQAAGVIGNMMAESGVEPERQESIFTHKVPADSFPEAGGGPGWGIVQWTPGTDIINTAHPKSDANDIGFQLNFLWTSLQGKGPRPESTQILKDIQGTTTIRDAVLAWQGNDNVGGPYHGFERPGDEQATVSQRVAYANQAYKAYRGDAPAADTSAGSSGQCDSSSSSGGSSDISAYKSPFCGVNNLAPSRIDQGVDYTGSGKICPIGNGKILDLKNDGWPPHPGAFIVYQLSDGPAKGKYVYFAENCFPIHVHIGQKVNTGTTLCDMIDASPHIEIGWADGNALGQALAADVWSGHDSSAYYTAYGENFSQLLQKLGVAAGTIQPGAQKLGKLPDGWPEWK
jgi:lysophospholipase L1-like esterase